MSVETASPADIAAAMTQCVESGASIEVSRMGDLVMVVVTRDGASSERPNEPVVESGESVEPSIRVFGSIGLTGCESTSVGGTTVRRVLAALAMHAGGVVSLDRLVDITWPDGVARTAAVRNLQAYVCRLRSVLPEELRKGLVTRPPGYALELGAVDAVEFERAVQLAGDQLRADSPDRAVALVDDALALWTGRPYSEFAEEGWARAEVTRLEHVRSEALDTRCRALLCAGRDAEALSSLEQLVDERPLWERPRQLQMVALYRHGRRVEALRVFQDFRALLAEEVGVSPSDTLVSLDRAIAVNDPRLDEAWALDEVDIAV